MAANDGGRKDLDEALLVERLWSRETVSASGSCQEAGCRLERRKRGMVEALVPVMEAEAGSKSGRTAFSSLAEMAGILTY